MAMTISIDDSLKQEFSDVCAEMGLSASAAFSVFAKAVVRERRIPFAATSEPMPARAERAEEQARREAANAAALAAKTAEAETEA